MKNAQKRFVVTAQDKKQIIQVFIKSKELESILFKIPDKLNKCIFNLIF
jgi:hypothetical protein